MDSMTKTGDSQIADSKIAKAAAGTVLDIKSEIIVCTPYTSISEYIGTRASLEAEGVIPPETEWPERGFEDVSWRDEQAEYTLRRDRPDGVSGPRKLFADIDWWSLRIVPAKRKHPSQLAIERKKKALDDEIFRQSYEGMRLIQKRYDDCCLAKSDAGYQRFRGMLDIDRMTSRRR